MESEFDSVAKPATRPPMVVLSLLIFALFLVGIFALHLILPFDQEIQNWLQEQRTCALDRVARIVAQWTTAVHATGILLLAAAATLAYRRRWQDLGSLIVIIAGAALLNEWFKEFVSRPRPNALSFIETGRSFPSGHATSALSIFGGIYYFIYAPLVANRWKRWIGFALLGALTLIVGLQRLYSLNHWPSDVIGGYLLSAGWFLLVLGALANRLGVKSLSMAAAGIAAAFSLQWIFPQFRVAIAPPARTPAVAVTRLDLSAYSPETIQPRHGRVSVDRPRQQIWRFPEPQTAIHLPLEARADHVLRFTARPEVISRQSECRHVEFALNGRALKKLIFSESWRDYEVPIPAGLVAEGNNQVSIRFDRRTTGALFLANPEVHRRPHQRW